MMDAQHLIAIFVSTVIAATPLIYAALGELVVERSGVLNLGVEGMMLIGAMTGFAMAHASGNLFIGYTAAILASTALSLLFAFLTLTMQANQVATGLALTLFGIGLSAFAGRSFAGLPIDGLDPVLFRFDWLVYGSIVLYVAVEYFFRRTRAGLRLRAIGESPTAAHALGQPVIRIRYLAVMFGGAMSGIAGAYLSTALTPMWVEGMSSGRGWIALALVVFATWKPLRVMLGAYLFGGVTVMQLHAQGFGLDVPSEILSMLPYLATIVVLVIICRDPKTILLNQPASLGRAFHPDT
jgi:ABC-type uncharacterized transport system permease subunit